MTDTFFEYLMMLFQLHLHFIMHIMYSVFIISRLTLG